MRGMIKNTLPMHNNVVWLILKFLETIIRSAKYILGLLLINAFQDTDSVPHRASRGPVV